MTSKVGIPHGAVLSQLLCNLYIGNNMDDAKSNIYLLFADDNTVVTHGQNLDEDSEIAIEDSKEIITVWCLNGPWRYPQRRQK